MWAQQRQIGAGEACRPSSEQAPPKTQCQQYLPTQVRPSRLFDSLTREAAACSTPARLRACPTKAGSQTAKVGRQSKEKSQVLSLCLPAESNHEVEVIPQKPHFLKKLRPSTRGAESPRCLRRNGNTMCDTALKLSPEVRPYTQGVLHDAICDVLEVLQPGLW
jgi:hypothetical protein